MPSASRLVASTRTPSGAGEELRDQFGAGRRLRLAGVDDDQHPPGGDVLHEGLRHRPARLGADPQHPGDGERHQARVGDPGDVDEPDPVRIGVDETAGHPDREPGLTRAAGAEDGHQPVRPDQPAEFGLFGLAADEGADLGRQVVRGGVLGTRAGEVPFQPVGADLEEALTFVEAAQPVQAQVEQLHPGGERAGVPGGLGGAEHLPTVGGRGDPGRPVHLRADVLAADRLGPAGVQPHPYPRRGLRVGPVVRGQGALGGQAGGERAPGVGEDDEEGVALGQQLRPVGLGERGAQQPAVRAQQHPVVGAEAPAQPGGPLDVGEHKGHQPAGKGDPWRHRWTSPHVGVNTPSASADHAS